MSSFGKLRTGSETEEPALSEAEGSRNPPEATVKSKVLGISPRKAGRNDMPEQIQIFLHVHLLTHLRLSIPE
jgi:hypothetical protein